MSYEPPFELPGIPRQHTLIGAGGFIESQDFVSGSSGWRIDGSGNFEGNDGTFRGNITGATGTFSGSLSAASGTIGGWTIGSSSLSNSGTSGTATLKSSGTSAGLWVSTTDSTTDGYIIINQGTDATYGNHSNLQMLAPAMTGSNRPGITIKHYVDGDSFIDIGTDDSDPQIRLTDRASGVDEMFLNATKIVINSSDADANLYFSSDTNTNINWSDANTAWTFNNLGTARMSIWAAGVVLNTCSVGTGTNVEINGLGVLVQDTSSIRYKNVADVNMADHLTPSMIDSLQPKMWSYKNDTSNHPQISLIAEEANGVSPFLITNEFDDDDNIIPAGLSTKGLISLLIIALKDARTRIAALES